MASEGGRRDGINWDTTNRNQQRGNLVVKNQEHERFKKLNPGCMGEREERTQSERSREYTAGGSRSESR